MRLGFEMKRLIPLTICLLLLTSLLAVSCSDRSAPEPGTVTGSCVDCHTDKDQLKQTASVVEEEKSEEAIPEKFDTFKVSVSISTTVDKTSEEALEEIKKILGFLQSAPNIKKSELDKVEAGVSASPEKLVPIYTAEETDSTSK